MVVKSMTTPMVDSVRTIPLVVEREMCEPMCLDETGFPFDRDFDRRADRDDTFQTQLDDIVKRHPEFAGHFEEFPFRRSGRFNARPSGHSSAFDFAFNRPDPFEEYYNSEPQAATAQPQPESQEQKINKDSNCQQDKEQKERSRRSNNIQQSQTVDLGQKQEPVNDRNQRSMSAPPAENRAGGGQRFVSSINIPIGGGGMGDMGGQQSQQQQQQTTNKPMERVIPIHVEGRDEPVIPKHTGPSYSQPQPERIFGQRPSQFTQFVNREQPHRQEKAPENMRQQQQQYQQQQQQKFQQEQQKQQQQEQKQEQPQPAQKINTPIDMIKSIQKDVSALMEQVEKFTGMPKDKQYVYLDEMLTRNLIKLDDIDTQGQENIRQARKEAVKCIHECISILEAKAAANVPKAQNQEEPVQEQQQNEPVDEKMDVENKSEEVPTEKKEEGSGDSVIEKMEVEEKDIKKEEEKDVNKKEQEEKPVEKMEEDQKTEEEKKSGEEVATAAAAVVGTEVDKK